MHHPLRPLMVTLDSLRNEQKATTRPSRLSSASSRFSPTSRLTPTSSRLSPTSNSQRFTFEERQSSQRMSVDSRMSFQDSLRQVKKKSLTKRLPTSIWGPEYERFVRMKRSGIPESAVLQAMQRSNMEVPEGFFMGEDQVQEEGRVCFGNGESERDMPTSTRDLPPNLGLDTHRVEADTKLNMQRVEQHSRSNLLSGLDASTLRKTEPVPTQSKLPPSRANLLGGFDMASLRKTETQSAPKREEDSMTAFIKNFDRTKLKTPVLLEPQDRVESTGVSSFAKTMDDRRNLIMGVQDYSSVVSSEWESDDEVAF